MNSNKGNQDQAKQDKSAPKQSQSQNPNHVKGREDAQVKGSERKPQSIPDKYKGNNRSGK